MSRAPRSLLLVMGIAFTTIAGCAIDSDAIRIEEFECPQDSDLSYGNFGAAFVDEHCQECHASLAENRHGAPRTFTFDTVEQVRNRRSRMFVRAATSNDSMPPGPDDPPLEARELFAEWLACGAP